MAAAVRDLGDESGGKALRHVLGRKRRAVAVDADLQTMDDASQVGLVVRGLPEAAGHRRGRPHRRQTLAAYVADEQPDPVPCSGRFIKVTADPRLLLGRQIQRLDLDVVQAAWQGAQQHLLGRVGHKADVEESLLPLESDMARICGRQGDRDDRRGRVLRPQVGVDEAEADHDQQAERPQQDRGEHGPHRRGKGGSGRQESADGDLPRCGERQAGDEEGKDHRGQRGSFPPATAEGTTAPQPSGHDHKMHHIGRSGH